MTRFKVITIMCIVGTLLTGCWDTIYIEDRGFIIGTAIDLEEEQDDRTIYSVTNQLVIPKGFANPSQGGGDQKAYLNIISKGTSIFRINEDLSNKTSKTPYYKHLKVIIVSKELAKKKYALTNLLDTYIRDVSTRRAIYLNVAEKEAKNILDFQVQEDQLPAIHITQLLEQSSDQAGFLKPITIGDIEELNLKKESYVIPYLTISNQITRKAGAVFHGPKEKMVGIFNKDEMQGLELFRENTVEKVIDFTYKGQIFAFEVVRDRSKSNIYAPNSGDIKVTKNIVLEGILKESFGKENLLKGDELDDVAETMEKEVKKTIEKAIDKAQNEYHADVLKIRRQLETKHYDIWQTVKDDWEDGENYFSDVTFDINVKTEIYSIGTSNKTR